MRWGQTLDCKKDGTLLVKCCIRLHLWAVRAAAHMEAWCHQMHCWQRQLHKPSHPQRPRMYTLLPTKVKYIFSPLNSGWALGFLRPIECGQNDDVCLLTVGLTWPRSFCPCAPGTLCHHVQELGLASWRTRGCTEEDGGTQMRAGVDNRTEE